MEKCVGVPQRKKNAYTMTHVSAATAAALKAAGFPFRTPVAGDFLARTSLEHSVLLVTGLYEGGYWLRETPPGFGEGRTTGEAFSRFYLLVPTAEDILEQLGAGWGVRLVASERGESFYSCTKNGPEPFAAETFNCSAETCAAAYLETRPDA